MILKTSHLRAALSRHPCIKAMAIVEVCASNELPLVELDHKKASIFIVNTDPNYKLGSHWIAIFIQKNELCSFFDPLGKPPSSYGKHIIHFLQLNSSVGYSINKTVFQNETSTACGFYSCLYLFKRMEGVSDSDTKLFIFKMSEEQVVSCVLPFLYPSTSVLNYCTD